MKTSFLKPADVEKKWYLIDAEGLILGRLSALIVTRLRGKHRPDYTPHIDCGDQIIVINADKIRVSGRKMTNRIYYRHTGYPGGIKQVNTQEILKGKRPTRLLKEAVRRMLPKESPLARKQLSDLRIYAGNEHPHTAQQPEKIDIKLLNEKNTLRAL